MSILQYTTLKRWIQSTGDSASQIPRSDLTAQKSNNKNKSKKKKKKEREKKKAKKVKRTPENKPVRAGPGRFGAGGPRAR